MATDLDLVRRLAAADRGLAVLATTRPDGTVHTSVVNAGVLDHPLTGVPSVGLVARGDASKLAHLRRAGRAAVVFRAGWEWVSVEGPVERGSVEHKSVGANLNVFHINDDAGGLAVRTQVPL